MVKPMSDERKLFFEKNIEEDMTGAEARAYIIALGYCVKQVAPLLRLSTRSVNENLDRETARHKFKLALFALPNVARKT